MTRPGEEWGSATADEPDLLVDGDDADLAAAVAAAPGALVRFSPSARSDIARAIGLTGTTTCRGVALPMDALRCDGETLAVNLLVLGPAPDRLGRGARRRRIDVEIDGVPLGTGPATTVVVATGEYLRGFDVVPRGHPGDGRLEVQVYAVPPGARRAMRDRLRTGTHLPHPAITQRGGRSVTLRTPRPVPLEVDGRPRGTATALVVEVVPAAYRLLV